MYYIYTAVVFTDECKGISMNAQSFESRHTACRWLACQLDTRAVIPQGAVAINELSVSILLSDDQAPISKERAILVCSTVDRS